MIRASVALYREALVALLILATALQVLPESGLIAYSDEVTTARSWNSFEAWLPYEGILAVWILAIVLLLAGILGALVFWRPARWMLVGMLFIQVACTPFLGLTVMSPFEAMLNSGASIILIWVVTVSFFSPLAER
mgnify:CR=1 FL=1